jgi:hypothetical protein
LVSSLDDAGSLVAFSFPRVLSDHEAPAEFTNNQLVYVRASALARALRRRPRSPHARTHGRKGWRRLRTIAPNSIAVAHGSNLALAPEEAARLARQTRSRASSPDNRDRETTGPRSCLYVSPGQINFHVPAETEIGPALVVARQPRRL